MSLKQAEFLDFINILSSPLSWPLLPITILNIYMYIKNYYIHLLSILFIVYLHASIISSNFHYPSNKTYVNYMKKLIINYITFFTTTEIKTYQQLKKKNYLCTVNYQLSGIETGGILI